MISQAQMKAIYEETAKGYNREPKSQELSAWMNVLSHLRGAQVDAAIQRWQSDVFIEEFTGRPRGARMPMAAELKLSIEQFERSQQAAASGNFIPCGRCQGGWVRVFHGVTIRAEGCQGSNQIDPKIGAVCRCQCWREYIALIKSGAAQATNSRSKTGNVVQMSIP